MAHILLIDDDEQLLDILSLSLEDAEHRVTLARDGQEGLRQIQESRPDLVLCDVNMPRVDGFTVCRRLRQENNPIPLILLTSRDSEIDQALGLELGADDYVAKPFSTRVLLARIGALLRREALRLTPAETTETLELGQLLLEPERLRVCYAGVEIETTVTEFRLLEAFAQRPGIVLSRDRLLDLIRGDGTVVADRIIDTYVRRLRRKLEKVDADFREIETVVGAGYRWRK